MSLYRLIDRRSARRYATHQSDRQRPMQRGSELGRESFSQLDVPSLNGGLVEGSGLFLRSVWLMDLFWSGVTVGGGDPRGYQNGPPYAISLSFQQFQGGCRQLCGVIPELPVEVRIVVGVHAAFESLGIDRSVKEARGDAQRANPIASRSCSADL